MSAVKPMPITATDAAKTRADSNPFPLALKVLTVLTVLGIAVGLYFALVYAGEDVIQREAQRIFYIHVSSFSGAFVAFTVTVIGGILYLRTRSTKWDILALAGVEVGLILALINLATGSIWAHYSWLTWWTWDPRLTSAAIMALTYAAYLMLRNGIENIEQRRRFASIYGILAITTVIVTLVIIRIEPNTIHPAVIGDNPQNAQGGFGLTDTMKAALAVNSIIWCTLIPATLIWYRVRLENMSERINALKSDLMES